MIIIQAALDDIGARSASKCCRLGNCRFEGEVNAFGSTFKIKATDLSSLPFPDRLVGRAWVWPKTDRMPVSNPNLTEI